MTTDTSDGGHIIASRYQLTKQLGQGGMGSVWHARDLTLGSPVAIKLIDASLAQDEGLSARFYQEAKSAASLRSPHVVQILDYGVDQGIPYIAMELLEGESLGERLTRTPILPYAETVRVFMDVARAMRKAHEAGIVHRDMKPDNIFLVRNDDQEVAKVLDFGIAKTTDASGAQRAATRTGTLIGTLPYMSPEQAHGTKVVDWRTDLWAMGAIAFQCVVGRLPFTSDATGEIILQICAEPLPVPSQLASVPQGFDAWWMRAASRDPALRFQSAKELVDTLASVLTPSTGQRLTPAPMSGPASLPHAVASGAQPPAPAMTGVQATTFGRSAFATGVAKQANHGTSRALVIGGIAAAILAIGVAISFVAMRKGADARPASAAGPSIGVDSPALGAPATLASTAPAVPVVTPANTTPEPSAKPSEKAAPLVKAASVAPRSAPPAAQKPPSPPAPSKKGGGPAKDRIGF